MSSDQTKIDNDFLLKVKKPTRYSGNEINAVKKTWYDDLTKVALVFPDLYEIGMSHLGLKILYHILNFEKDILAERVFAPANDLEANLRTGKLKLFSLENKRPLTDFDVLGFTLQYEMSYSNILNILSLSEIPFYSKERDEAYPLVIGGGSGVANPEPIAPFFDCFLIGDGEKLFLDFIEVYRAAKQAGLKKKEILKRLAALEGVYVPEFYQVEYDNNGAVTTFKVRETEVPETVFRVIVKDLNQVNYPTKFIIPYMDIVHDRLNIEINRGCTRGCRFRQAGMFYRPVRRRGLEKIMDLASEGIKNTGYEDLSLLSLCASDYPQIGELLTQLAYDFSEKRVSTSLPSLRFDSFFVELAQRIREIRKTGLTFALEAATQRLRDVINKGAKDSDLVELTDKLWELGWRNIKVYFMIGLPTEEMSDVHAIPELVKRLKKRKKGKSDVKVNVTPFVPKAQTPFQWEPFAPPSELKEKLDFLYHNLRKKVTSNILELSLLEAAFSRGDRRLAPILVTAWEKGAKFDQWREHFNFKCWEESFAEHKINLEAYATRRFNLEDRLPWDHIDLGVSKDYLIEEWQKAHRAELTPDCTQTSCQECGVCDADLLAEVFQKPEVYQPRRRTSKTNANLPLLRVRVKYTKQGEITLLSHLDLVRVFRRAIRRADLPVCYSQGFSPQPKISFGIPLTVGTESDCELLDMELSRPRELAEIKELLGKEMPRGIEIVEVSQIRHNEPSLTKGAYVVTYEAAFRTMVTEQETGRRIKEILLSESLPFTRVREKRTQKLNLRPFIKSLRVKSGEKGCKLEMELIYNDRGTVKPNEIMRLVFADAAQNIQYRRTGISKLWGGRVV